jgi:hypothetical protein
MAANQMEDFVMPNRTEASLLKSVNESELLHSYFLEEGNVLTDSGSFFSQLDSMIEAVKVESSALDTMRDRLKEVDNLRTQIAIFNKRLIDADQANLNLKSMLMKAQESSSNIKQQKADLESQNTQLRTELNRVKENYQKEKNARQAAQTEIISLRDQLHKYEKSNEHYEREVKAIPALQESNELLKNDLAQARRKFREEKAQMAKYIKSLEAQHVSTDALRADVRGMAMRLLEISNVTTTGGATTNSMPNMGQQQPPRSSYNPSASYQSQPAPFYGGNDDEDDDDDDGIIGSSYEAADDELDIKSYLADESLSDFSYKASERMNPYVGRQPPPPQQQQRTVVMGQTHNNNQASLLAQQQMQQAAAVAAEVNGGSGGKKKKKKATVVARQSAVSLPRLMN